MLNPADCIKALRLLKVSVRDIASFTGYSFQAVTTWDRGTPPSHSHAVNIVNELAYRTFHAYRVGLLPLKDEMPDAQRREALRKVLFYDVNLSQVPPESASKKLRPIDAEPVEEAKTQGETTDDHAVADTASAV